MNSKSSSTPAATTRREFLKTSTAALTGAALAGDLDPVAGSYTGYSTLAHTQRVMAAAHGGQILLGPGAQQPAQSAGGK